MTPEERLDRIEKALDRQIEFVAGTNQKQDERIERLTERMEKLTERMEGLSEQIEKHSEGIRGLIVVARTCVDSIQEMRATHDSDHRQVMAEMMKLEERQAATDEKLNILIHTVDRIIGHRPQ